MVRSSAGVTTCRFRDQFSLPPFAASVLAKVLMLGFLVLQVPTSAQESKPISGKNVPAGSQLGTGSPNAPADAVRPEAVTNEELAHRIRILELKAAENEAKAAEEGNKSYSAVWVPLVTGIIGAIVVFLSARIGRAGQEAESKRSHCRLVNSLYGLHEVDARLEKFSCES
jgi:hypothetical protein